MCSGPFAPSLTNVFLDASLAIGCRSYVVFSVFQFKDVYCASFDDACSDEFFDFVQESCELKNEMFE